MQRYKIFAVCRNENAICEDDLTGLKQGPGCLVRPGIPEQYKNFCRMIFYVYLCGRICGEICLLATT